MAIYDGGSAFPRPHSVVKVDDYTDEKDHYAAQGGMSLRDWFAGQALAGLANEESIQSHSVTAQLAYQLADAMLAAKSKE